MELSYSIFVVASIITAYATAYLFAKGSKFDFLDARKNRSGCLDGLRGYLALLVLTHHFYTTCEWKETGKWSHPESHYIDHLGLVPVSIFFMITGFLFVGKIARSPSVDWFRLYKSRFFRILPLYLFAILAISIFVFSESNFQTNSSLFEYVKQYAKWILFIGNTINENPNTRTVIAAVDWTLRYEWIFYFSLPIIYLALRTPKKLGLIPLCGLVAYFYFSPIVTRLINTEFFLLFIFGGLTAFILNAKALKGINLPPLLRSLVSLALFSAAIFYPNTLDLIHIALIFLFFLNISLGDDLFGLLRSKPSLIMGEISYSIYLLHGIILYLFFTTPGFFDLSEIQGISRNLLLSAISPLVIVLSVVTFLSIENPMIKLGHRRS